MYTKNKKMSLENFCNLGLVFSGGEGEGDASGDAGGDAGGDIGDDIGGVFTLPDQYKDKLYLQGVDSTEKVFKLLDDSQTLIGKKRTVLPDETSTPDDVAAFHELRGVPKDHNEYKPANTEEGTDNSLFDKMKPVFKKANLTQKDVTTLIAELNPILEEITGKKISNNKANDEAFETLTAKVFGATKDNDLAQAKALLVANTPEGMSDYMATLDNRALTIMASALKNVRAKYMNEDNMDHGGDSIVSSANAIRDEGKKQIEIAQDLTKTIAEKEIAAKKANEAYAKYQEIMKKNDNNT